MAFVWLGEMGIGGTGRKGHKLDWEEGIYYGLREKGAFVGSGKKGIRRNGGKGH